MITVGDERHRRDGAGEELAAVAEGDAGAGGGGQHLARQLPLRFLGEIQAAAMHGNQHVRIELADLADDLREIIRRRRPQMKHRP